MRRYMRCNTCGGEYWTENETGTRYFHVCPTERVLSKGKPPTLLDDRRDERPINDPAEFDMDGPDVRLRIYSEGKGATEIKPPKGDD